MGPLFSVFLLPSDFRFLCFSCLFIFSEEPSSLLHSFCSLCFLFIPSMAKASHPSFVASTPEPVVDGDRRMAPEPEVVELLQSQVILPFTLGSKTHAFLGPLLSPSEAQNACAFFPCAPDQSILVSRDQIFIKHFVSSKRPFRSLPKNSPEFVHWLDRVQMAKGDHWKTIGIFDFIQLFRHPISFNPSMLGPLFYF